MDQDLSPIESAARQQIAERIADARSQRLANHLPGNRRHRLGLGLRRRNDGVEN